MPSSPYTGFPENMAQSEGTTSYGQVVEYIQDRLYLASYTHPPNPRTPFPYPSTSKHSRSPSKRSQQSLQSPSSSNSIRNAAKPAPVYFSVDNTLLYNAFHHDFGPLHIGHLYRFAVQLHEVLGDPENEGRAVVFWTHADSRSRSNAACMLACYMVLIQSWPPHLALAPIVQMDPPLMPFRDAGYSQADYILNVQDVVYGVWKAKEEGLCGLKNFSLEEYEKFERVEMGDFNWITQDFLAFASPQHQPTAIIPPTSEQYASLPKTSSEVLQSNLPSPFKNVLAHFKSRDIGLVVRLNSELYSPSYFTALGIKHIDMIFEDGTCPQLPLVRRFIQLAHDSIVHKKRGVAVHCKAGLGRTGCLIGAYLIYRYGFTANEIIAFMRFMRPGMVVGPQQHWLHLNQGTFREWWFEDSMKDKIAAMKRSTPPRATNTRRVASNGQTFTPPNGQNKRRALGELDYNEKSTSPCQEENLPAPTPGQPRKTSKLYGEKHNLYTDTENEPLVEPNTEIVSIARHVQGESESEEEFQLRMMARKTTKTPTSGHKKRAVSCTTTTTMTREWSRTDVGDGGQSAKPRTPPNSRSGNGSGNLSVGKRVSPVRRSTDMQGGIRKTSARVGSAGALSAATRIKQ